jgi:hypothetical protein
MYTNPTTGKPYYDATLDIKNWISGGNILESTPVFQITTDEDESYDWAVVLDFFDKMARARHMILNTVEISNKIRKLIGEE